MSAGTPCPACGCHAPGGGAAHGVLAALLAGDIDAAISVGLLQADRCAGCSADCSDALLGAREERLAALAARERYRARNERLQGRAAELAARRSPAPSAGTTPATATRPGALPPGVAAALARAKAKAAERKP
jgi:hypothetical protein